MLGDPGNAARTITVMLIGSLGLGLFVGYLILQDPATSVGWKAFFVCAGSPVFIVLIFLIVCIIYGGRHGSK